MRVPLGTFIVSLAVSATAYAQSLAIPVAAPAAAVPAATVPVPMTKRFACQTAAQGIKGQDRRDQMQLCMAQARMDCLKQAIDQKIVGPKRMDFIKACTG
jgi:curli biogenesis system outer membrane secretion channel CsgG